MALLWFSFVVLLLIAFVFLCSPLINRKSREYTQQQQHNIAIFKDRVDELEQEKLQGQLAEADFVVLKAELEKNLLQEAGGIEDIQMETVEVNKNYWFLSSALGLFVTVVSVSMYFSLGRSDDLLISQTMAAEQPMTQTTTVTQGKPKPPSIEQSIAILEAKLEKEPDNAEMLLLLANSYSMVGQFIKGADIYASMAEKVKDIPEQYAGLKGAEAQSVYQASGEKFTSRVKILVEQALKADAEEPSSLMLLGIEAFTAEKYPDAIVFWKKAKHKAGEGQIARFIDPAIQAAEAKSGVESTVTKQVVDSARIKIDLSLSADLKNRVTDDLTVYIFAREVGQRMPLAIEKLTVKDLPIQVVLDDSKAAMPTAKLSSVAKVEIMARISMTGQPVPQAGDLFVLLKDITVTDNASLVMEINQVVE